MLTLVKNGFGFIFDLISIMFKLRLIRNSQRLLCRGNTAGENLHMNVAITLYYSFKSSLNDHMIMRCIAEHHVICHL